MYHQRVFPGFNEKHAIIDSGIGLAPNRRQTITWSKYGPLHWRKYASLDLNALNGGSKVSKALDAVITDIERKLNLTRSEKLNTNSDHKYILHIPG